MTTVLILAGVLFILPSIKTYKIKRFFNFKGELKHIKRKPKIKQPTDTSQSTLIGYAGKKPIYIPDNAKHVFICGTTGSGKTVGISNFINQAIKNDYPTVIIDGKGDTGEGSILDITVKMSREKNKK